MTAALAIAAAAVVAVVLVLVGLRMARRGGESRGAAEERSQRLAESAERRAEADRVAALPLPVRGQLGRLWRRYRRLRDPESR